MTVQIAIDGPSGSGKSTLAKTLAAKLGYVYVDTGALYRAVGLYVFRRQADPFDAEATAACLPKIELALAYEAGTQHVFLNGEDVSSEIRLPEIAKYASAVSAHPAVRAFLLDTQRRMAETHNVIMDGRDIGTVILPKAQVKFFMTTAPEECAKRRWEELTEKGIEITYEQVLADQKARDAADSSRKTAPLRAAEDAIPLNTIGMTQAQTAEMAYRLIKEKLGLDK